VCSILQNAKHEPSRGVWGHAPPKNFLKNASLRLNLVLFEAQNCYAKDRLWKSAVREIIGSIYLRTPWF